MGMDTGARLEGSRSDCGLSQVSLGKRFEMGGRITLSPASCSGTRLKGQRVLKKKNKVARPKKGKELIQKKRIISPLLGNVRLEAGI